MKKELLTEHELYELSKQIDRLDSEITLEERTISDIRLSIRACQQRKHSKQLIK